MGLSIVTHFDREFLEALFYLNRTGHHLTPGQAHDGRQFESLSESLPADNMLESAALDKGDDADRIRERLSRDGIGSFVERC